MKEAGKCHVGRGKESEGKFGEGLRGELWDTARGIEPHKRYYNTSPIDTETRHLSLQATDSGG